MKRTPFVIVALAGAFVLLSAFIAVARVGARNRERAEMAQLGARYAGLRDSLRVLAARDSLARLAETSGPGVAIALAEPVLVDLLEEGAGRYVDQVEVDLETEFGGHGEGELETKTPLGQMTLGEWRVIVTVHEMKAVLTTLRPVIQVADTNRLDVALPVRVLGGHGRITLDFKWNSKGIFNAVCLDWKARQTLAGAILPQRHLVHGALAMHAGPHGIVADPDFPPVRFPIAMDLDADSWERIRKVLEDENALRKCGILIHPDEIVAKLRETGLQGLRFRLPRAVYRPIELPGGVTRSVRILGTPVELAIVPVKLRLVPGVLWCSAAVEARRANGSAAPPPQ